MDWAFRKMRSRIDRRVEKHFQGTLIQNHSPFHTDVVRQLEEYFCGIRKKFDLPICLSGTEFQNQVWRTLQDIPYGSTVSYKALSETLGNPLAIRAIASANGANTHAILIPCHRVIGSNGEMVGYAGGASIKKKLLQIEGALPSIEQYSLF